MGGEESRVSNVLWLVEQRKGKESRKSGEWGFEPSPLCNRIRRDALSAYVDVNPFHMKFDA